MSYPPNLRTLSHRAVLRLHNKLVLHGREILQPLLDQLRQVRDLELRRLCRKVLAAADGGD